jgi:hypothetical protein
MCLKTRFDEFDTVGVTDIDCENLDGRLGFLGGFDTRYQGCCVVEYSSNDIQII